VSPEKAEGPVAHRPPDSATDHQMGRDYNTTTTTQTSSSGSGSVGIVRLTTTRRCDGSRCWCRIGDGLAWPMSHWDEMQRMARQIRRLEISQGVML
jgi:hypothetical protein